MGTNIRFSTAFHPQTGGQVERVNQILEDMLRACVISFGMKWEDCLPYAEFSYNNSFQASSGKAPFEILYGRKCHTPLNWSETGERQLLGNDLITEAEEMCKVIREYLKAAQSRQKSYYDSKHRDLAFEIRDHVYLQLKVRVASVSKGSLPLDTWVLSRSLAKEAISPINLSFRPTL